MRINVNGRWIDVLDKTEVTYEDILELATGKKGYDYCLTVVYSGPRHGDMRRSGEMHKGCNPVKLEDGMVFTAMDTSNA